MGVIAMRCVAVVAGLLATLVSATALADPDAGAPTASPEEIAQRICARSPTHELAMTVESNVVGFMKVAVSDPLQGKQTLDMFRAIPAYVRSDVTALKCEESVLSPKELREAQALETRAAKWADDEDKVLAAEDAARAGVVVPLCEAVWGRDAAQATIDHERANPSGVVDLQTLHGAGESLQYYRAQIAALAPLYVAARHHAFTTWQAEGACVAEANKPDGS